MSDFLDLARRRYSVRTYLPQPVEAEKLERILEAGRVAPTAKNNQPHRILIVQSPEGLEKLTKCTNVQGYPLGIVVCGVQSEAWVSPFDPNKNSLETDTSIVATHMLLEATDLGLGSFWMMRFEQERVREAFNIPEGIVPEHILAIGYASGGGKSPGRHDKLRKPLETTIVREHF